MCALLCVCVSLRSLKVVCVCEYKIIERLCGVAVCVCEYKIIERLCAVAVCVCVSIRSLKDCVCV